MYQNYFFDFDGTLYDTYGGMVSAFVSAFENQGVKLDKSETYRLMRVESVRYCFALLKEKYPKLDEKKLHEDYHFFEKENRESWLSLLTLRAKCLKRFKQAADKTFC